MSLSHDEGWSIPFDRPFYPALPANYRNVRFQYVFFRTEPSAGEHLLPDPLEPSDDGLCFACGLVVPFCSSYGSFQEAYVQQSCSFRGQDGWYCSHVLHDGPAGIAAGREIYGTPKIFAEMEVKQVDRVMTTTGRMGGLPVITVASTAESPCSPEEMLRPSPSWRLKIIPRADGPGPAIKQLIDGSPAAQDIQVHTCFKGTGTVRFDANPLCDLSALKPIEFLDAYYLEMSFSEGFAEIAYDYLTTQ
ncbi:MAG: acetoacetate decarboxylase family protein [Planctomycetota bacterium]|jgi:acetoacetate decarboxylase|nr:acetoacetate decarboxylase family protein [Planctomycetota bacterium]